MRRILLATTAIVALSAAASPAFAFNVAAFAQGNASNNVVVDQTDHGPGSPFNNYLTGQPEVLDNGNTALGASIGKNNNDEFHQTSARYSTNFGYSLQTGDHNNAVLNQTTSEGTAGTYHCEKYIVGGPGTVQGGTCYSTLAVWIFPATPGKITYTPGSTVYKNESWTTQLGDYNSVKTTQATTASNGTTKGNNKSTVVQTGFFNGANVNQKGGSTQTTTQTGILQLANTTQDGNNNNSTTKQHGPLLGGGALQFSSVSQKGDNNSQTTDQNGFLQASITSQNGNGNKSDTSQSGILNGSATFQNNGATSTTKQDGALNGSLVIQDGANTQTTTQTGNVQLAVTAQGGGSGNSSTTTQDGGINVSGVGQLGSGNTATVSQSGGNNWSAVGQVGTGNTATVTQHTAP
jgi:hypothetical protein